MAALGMGAVLACAGCQPDTGNKDAAATAASAPAAEPAPPVPSAPGQVTEAQGLDLKPQVTEAVISTDQGGARMALERTADTIRLTMPRAGMSRVQLSAVLDPGEYDVHLQLGAVQVQDQAAGGFGAFFGPENNREKTVELKPNAEQRVHLSIPTKRQAFFSLGFGGWGKASGSMEIRTLEIVKAPKA